MAGPEELTSAFVERRHILAVLKVCEGNRTQAASALGISLRCLRDKLREYKLSGATVTPAPPSDPTSQRLHSEIAQLFSDWSVPGSNEDEE